MDSSWKERAEVASVVTSMSNDTASFVSGLWKLWVELGYDDKVCMDRLRTARHHIAELMSEMKSEEEHAVDKLRDLTKILTNECQDVAKELQITHTMPTAGKLLAYHDAIKKQRDELRSERARRLKEYDILVNEERRLCECMRMEAVKFSPPKRSGSRHRPVPTQQELDRMSRTVADLQTKEMTRKKQFISSRSEILDFFKQLDYEPSDYAGDEFVQAAVMQDVSKFVLSIENLKALEALRKKLSDKVADLEQTGRALEAKIVSLWSGLSMDHDKALLDQHSAYTGRDIKALGAIVAELDEKKMAHLQDVINNVRTSISALHDKLGYGDHQREDFKLIINNEATCEILEEHQAERCRLQSELDQNASLYHLVQRRETLWKSKMQFEHQQMSNDFKRYKDRGGEMLKQLKMQQKIDKDLPKMESEIRTLVKSWEHRRGKSFIAFDEVYVDYMADQWAELTALREEHKQKRKEQKIAKNEEERIYGSKAPPTTPLKQRTGMTPVSVRSRSRIDHSVTSAGGQRMLHSSLKGAFLKSPCPTANTTNTSIISNRRQNGPSQPQTPRITRSMAASRQRVPLAERNKAAATRQPSHLAGRDGKRTTTTTTTTTAGTTGGVGGKGTSQTRKANRTTSSTSASQSTTSSLAQSCDENNPCMSMTNISYAAFKTGLALGPGGNSDTSHCCATSVARTTFV